MTDFLKNFSDDFSLPLTNPVLEFSLILLIILLSPILLKRLKIPGIIGLIISGVLIGPFGFNLLEKNSAVDLFSTIGLLYIMFIAGLDLDMNEFKASRHKSILFGFFTFITPVIIGFPVCFFLLDYSFNVSFMIASMLAAHTLIAYPILSKFGITKNKAVAVTVGGTIITDTAVLIILALIMGNRNGTIDQSFWVGLGLSLIIFSVILFIIIPRIAKWFFRKMESEKHAHYIFVLAVVFFAAFLAEVAGLEPIIGAFLAGLAINRLIPPSSALMNRIEFIGNALFIPFFLISVGMLVDVSVIFKGPMAIIIAITLSLIALLGKYLAALFTQLILGYSKAQRNLIFGLSSSRAAATLAFVLVGYKAGILDENILNGTIIMILVTCIFASFQTEKAAKVIALNSQDEFDTISGSEISRHEHILLPIANIENFEKLLEFALLLKSKVSVHPVSVLYVVPNDQDAEMNILKSQKKLKNFINQASASEINVNVITTIDHNAASGISRTAKEIMSDIIIIGWPQHSGIISKITGDKAESIIGNTDKTVFICNLSMPLSSVKRIVVLAPPLSEKEIDFELWIQKISAISKESSRPVILYANNKSIEFIGNYLKVKHINFPIEFMYFNHWNNFHLLTKDILQTDLLVFITARKGSVSYYSQMENIPLKLEKFFKENSKILVYTKQHDFRYKIEGYEVDHSTLNTGIESVQKIGKNIGNIFRKNKE